MNRVCQEDLIRLSRRLSDVADNTRRVAEENNWPPALTEAVGLMVRAEALLLETAKF